MTAEFHNRTDDANNLRLIHTETGEEVLGCISLSGDIAITYTLFEGKLTSVLTRRSQWGDRFEEIVLGVMRREDTIK